MKILHFSANDKGGAGIAAVRYHTLLKQLGYDSTLYVEKKQGEYADDSIIELSCKTKDSSKRKKQAFVKIVKRLLHLLFNNRIERKFYSLFYTPKKKENIDDLLGKSYCFYNFNDANVNGCFPGVEDKIFQGKVDIIFIHWMGGYLNTYDMKRLYEKTHARFIFTMMDIEPVTGGCHYPWDCKEYRKNCFNCPALPFEKKSLAIKQHTAREINLNYIHPDMMLDSEFDSEHAINSTINFRKIFFCYYPIDETVFYPKEKTNDVFTIFSIGNFMSDYRKGGRFVMEVLFNVDRAIDKKVKFLCLDKSNFEQYEFKNIEFEEFEFCKDVNELANIYRKADVFLCTAIEDAAPMMLMEALMCGLPTVSFDIALAKALIEDEKDGYIVPLYDINGFSEKLLSLIQGGLSLMRSPQGIHEKMVSIYGIKAVSNQIKDVINDKQEKNMKTLIPFNKPPVVGTELRYIEQAISSGKICGDGSFTKKCSDWFEDKTGAKKVLLTTSCTHALEMAAMLCDIKTGDEVIMPSYTFCSTADAFALRGAKIIFVDIRPDTMNIDEKLIEDAITPKTKVIVAVHYAGVACEMDTIMEIAKRHNLKVVEDAAQGVMSSYKGQVLGTIGDFGCYSFHETKNYSMGEGGALLINNEKDVERAEIIREKGTNRSMFFRGQIDKYSWVDIGSSYLPSELNAAFLFAQLENSQKIMENRMYIWNYYNENLRSLEKKDEFELPVIPSDCMHNAHMFYIKFKNLQERTEFIAFAKEKGISCPFHYVPLHSSVAGKKYGIFFGNDEYTTKDSDRLVRLPLWYGMSDEMLEYVVETVKEFIKNKENSADVRDKNISKDTINMNGGGGVDTL